MVKRILKKGNWKGKITQNIFYISSNGVFYPSLLKWQIYVSHKIKLIKFGHNLDFFLPCFTLNSSCEQYIVNFLGEKKINLSYS